MSLKHIPDILPNNVFVFFREKGFVVA